MSFSAKSMCSLNALPVRVWYPEQRTLLPVVAERLPEMPAAAPGHLELTGLT